MNLGTTDAERQLRTEVREVLAEPDVHVALDALSISHIDEPDVRPLYRALGKRGLLAVGWPVEYGGRGGTHSEAAAVIEELVHAGVPDMVHVLSVQIVGLFLLRAGTAEQKAAHLPALAAGERFATVLYTEPDVGSDLAALSTRAVRTSDGDGYRLHGVKVYGLKSAISDLALCAARTSEGTSKYEGISLFLIDLDAAGVSRSTLPNIADDQFDRIQLDDVHIGTDGLLGAEGEGWPLLTECLALERVGLDYSLKAARWYDAMLAALATTAATDDALLAEVGRHGAAVDTGRLLVWDVLRLLDRDTVDPAASAMAKYHTSETAQRIANWAALTHGAGYPTLEAADAKLLEAAYREAPGVTLSAGTSQIMLEFVANSALDWAQGD